MSAQNKAVFLSYASQDADAARRICEALRAAAVEVWFDQRELRGGDAWDQKIRRQIKECALFVPIISANTQARAEGYFRLEWRLADQRTHLMGKSRPFLVPVCIDDTRDSHADVPDSFVAVQWIRLPDGEPREAFCERVKALLESDTGVSPAISEHGPDVRAISAGATPALPGIRARRWLVPTLAGAAAVIGGSFAVWQWQSGNREADQPEPAARRSAPPTSENSAAQPPLDLADAKSSRSIAVLPFANLSAEKDSEYFSDGLTEEILNALARDPALRVAARTSSFSFKGRNVPVGEIGRTLRVAHVIEGSVRRAGNRVRITVQLINAADGYHAWRETFEREMDDIFALQDEIALKVAQKLGVISPVATRAPGAANPPTQNLAAYDAYLRARALHMSPGRAGPDIFEAVRQYEAVVRLDPGFALAWAHLAQAAAQNLRFYDESDETRTKARNAADTALRLAPNLPEAHTAQAAVLLAGRDYDRAIRELGEAEKLRPNDGEAALLRAWAELLRGSWTRLFWPLAQRAVDLDPQSTRTLWLMGLGATVTGHFAEAEDWLSRAPARQSSATFVYRAMNRVAWDGDIGTALAQMEGCPETFRNEWIYRSFARLHEMARDDQPALRAWERALIAAETDPQTSGARNGHIESLMQVGKYYARKGDTARAQACYERAAAEAEKLVIDYPSYSTGLLTLASVRIQRGERQLAEAALAKGWGDKTAAPWVYFSDYAAVLTQLGRMEEAIAELRRLHESGIGFGHLLRLEPKWDPLRLHPKFQQLTREAEARAKAVPRARP